MNENLSDEQQQDEEAPEEESTTSSSSAVEREEARLKAAIDRYQQHIEEQKKALSTQYLEEEDGHIPESSTPAFGSRTGAASFYAVLPAHLDREDATDSLTLWRIELHGLAPGVGPIGLDIVGDVVIGRKVGSTSDVDFGLDSYNAAELGVSRRHAMLRPTKRRLFLIDLGSTNGTMVNATPLNSGMARALEHNDTLTFGRLTCRLELIDYPGSE